MTDQDRSDLEEAIRLLRVVRSIKPGLTFIGIMRCDDWAAKVDALLARHPEKPKLLPCPFCGWNVSIFVRTEKGGRAVQCTECGVQGGRWANESSAAIAWNSRATPVSGPVRGGKGE